jgi:hypothetical protein
MFQECRITPPPPLLPLPPHTHNDKVSFSTMLLNIVAGCTLSKPHSPSPPLPSILPQMSSSDLLVVQVCRSYPRGCQQQTSHDRRHRRPPCREGDRQERFRASQRRPGTHRPGLPPLHCRHSHPHLQGNAPQGERRVQQ